MIKEIQRYIKRYTMFMVPIGIIVGVVLLFLFVFFPLFNQISSLFEQRSQLKEQVTVLKDKLKILDSYDEETLNTYMTELSNAIPIEKSPQTIIKTIEQLGNEVGATVRTIDIQNVGSLASQSATVLTGDQRSFGAFTIPFTVSITASFDQIQQFLQKTATIRRFIRVRSFNIRFSDSDQIDMQIILDAFYLPLKERQSSIITPLTVSEEDIVSTVRQMQNLVPQMPSTIIPIVGDPNRNPFSL